MKSIQKVKDEIMYRYDTHVHTSESSACASISGAEQAELYKELGYTGIIVTDHFLNGNSTVPNKLSWEEKIQRFSLGYDHALETGKEIGLSVFFGWEESFVGADYLVYGLDKEWLIKHPEILSWDLREHYNRIHAAGGYIVHAHPFRYSDYMTDIPMYPNYEDAIETINASHRCAEYNQRAIQYATLHHKPVTGGSDAHHADSIHGGMIFKHELKDIRDFIQSVERRKDITVIPV